MSTISGRGVLVTSGVVATWPTKTLQDQVDTAIAAGHGVVQLDKGTYTISDTIHIRGANGLRIRGLGVTSTNVVWTGPDNVPAFDFDQSQDCGLEDMTITASDGLLEAVRIQASGDYGSQTASRTHLVRVFIQGAGMMGTGVRIKEASGKNDHNFFEQLQVQDYTDSGVKIEGQASVNNVFVACVIQGRDGGQYGVYAASTTSLKGGKFRFYGGEVMENQLADFYVDAPNGTVVLSGVRSEQSGRLLIVPSTTPSYSALNVTCEGITWFNSSAVMPADSEVIQVYSGNLSVRGCCFGHNTESQDLKFRYDVPVARQACFLFEGNIVNTALSSGWFTGSAPDSKVGSYAWNGSTTTMTAM